MKSSMDGYVWESLCHAIVQKEMQDALQHSSPKDLLRCLLGLRRTTLALVSGLWACRALTSQDEISQIYFESLHCLLEPSQNRRFQVHIWGLYKHQHMGKAFLEPVQQLNEIEDSEWEWEKQSETEMEERARQTARQREKVHWCGTSRPSESGTAGDAARGAPVGGIAPGRVQRAEKRAKRKASRQLLTVPSISCASI